MSFEEEDDVHEQRHVDGQFTRSATMKQGTTCGGWELQHRLAIYNFSREIIQGERTHSAEDSDVAFELLRESQS